MGRLKILNDSQLFDKAMIAETKYMKYLYIDKFIGPGSRVMRLFEEANLLWKEIHRRAFLKKTFSKVSLVKQQPKIVQLNPYS